MPTGNVYGKAEGLPQQSRFFNNAESDRLQEETLFETDALKIRYGGTMNRSASVLPIIQPLFAPGILYNSINSGS